MSLETGASADPHRDPPLFVIRHVLEIEGSAEATWAVLSDLARYPEWNPYVLALDGELVPGRILRVKITQANWPEPLVVEPTVMRAEPERVLHWRGCVGERGVLDTDHVFAIEPLSANRIRFDQYEEFRGRLAENMDGEMRGFTQRAFEAMNEALAERVRALS